MTGGVVAAIVNDDSRVVTPADIAAFAIRHDLRTITLPDLVVYRQLLEA